MKKIVTRTDFAPLLRVADRPPVVDEGSQFRSALSTARKAAAAGDIQNVEELANILGARFGDPIELATALVLHAGELDQLEQEDDYELVKRARRLLRSENQLGVPLWKHQANGLRVWMYETPAEIDEWGVPVTGAPANHPEVTELPDDPRVQALLPHLNVTERNLLLAWLRPGVYTWQDARLEAGGDPRITERLRQKVRRLSARSSWRKAA
ncbi:hypothetical protein ACFCW4_06820 [Streptomyces virginiae]|uniref:hypothetical protein n=1 Tax=Streptomyces virginiae TaxID=1961 RepID=UPI0035D8FC54